MRNRPHKIIDPTTLRNGLKSPQMYYALFADGHMIENDCGNFKFAIQLAREHNQKNPKALNIHIRRYDRSGYSDYEEIVWRYQ